jgi:DNA-binding IclR family transcriptional regulator
MFNIMESTTLIKAFALMEATAGSPGGRTLRDLSADVGASKPTVHRILNTLVSLGYMEKPLVGTYRQTPDARRLVSGTHQSALLEASKPVLQQLFEKTGETVNLGVLRHDKVLYLHVLECTHPLRHVVSLETADPFHSTALGRAIVAFLPDDQCKTLLKNPSFEKRTPRTISNVTDLRRLLDAARDQGFAVEEDETDLGVTCIGAPIIVRDRAVAAISVAAPTARVTDERRITFVEEIQTAAAKISAALDNA